jgi:DNA-binding beta-propeller fold protein YncE
MGLTRGGGVLDYNHKGGMVKMNFRPGLSVALVGVCLAAGTGWGQYLETTIPIGAGPLDVLWNPTSNKVYTSDAEAGTVTIVDGALNSVIGSIAVPGGAWAMFLCWNSAQNIVYCTCSDPDWLMVIDGVGDTLIRKVRMRGAPTKMEFNALMNKLYVACYDDKMVRVYDCAADTLVAEVWLGESNIPDAMLWHPVTNRVFCTTSGNADSVLVIDCALDVMSARVSVGRQPYGMTLNPVNGNVYVKTRFAVYALTPPGDSIVAVVDGWSCGVAAVPFPNKVYAAGWGPGLGVIDCYTNTMADSLAVSAGDMVCDTIKAKVYAVGEPAPVIDARADTLLLTVPIGSSPQAICWNSTNSRVYIADYSGLLYVIRDTSTAVAEPPDGHSVRDPRVSAVVRGRLVLASGTRQARLLDTAGRFVMELHPGVNDVASLRRGVYFLSRTGTRQVTKIVVQ